MTSRSHLRDALALSCLLILLAVAQLIALSIGIAFNTQGLRSSLDWHRPAGVEFSAIRFEAHPTALLSRSNASAVSDFASI